jgi:hypothetical protein
MSAPLPNAEALAGQPNTSPRNVASGAVVSRNWVNTRAFSWRAAISSAISRSRTSLPLSSSLTVLVCLAPGFLIACASSITTSRHEAAQSHGAREIAVTCDREVAAH